MRTLFAQATNVAGTNAPSTEPAPSSENSEANDPVAEVVAEPSWISDLFIWVSDLFDSGAIGLLLDGGFFMWPILIMAILALAVFIERWRSLKMLDTDNESLRQAVLDDLTNDRVEDALARCETERGPVAAVIANGLRKYFGRRF